MPVTDNTWKTHKFDDGREILSHLFSTDSLAKAQQITSEIIELQEKENYPEKELQLSLSTNGVLVILHGVSSGPVSATDHNFANAISSKFGKK